MKENASLRFVIFGNEYQPKKSQAIHKIVSALKQRGAEIYIDRPFYKFLAEGQHLSLDIDGVFDGEDFTADFAVSMGGDGTLLKTAARVSEKGIPVVGVNIGRLGFLADVTPSEIEGAVAALYDDNYSINDHSVIKVETSDDDHLTVYPYALNDVALLKRDHASMISIRANVNDEYVTTYQADGLIVTTPTGSTAYSLSNGGPIIAPGTDTLCITPVAPHSLNMRPIVLTDSSVITLKVESRSHSFLVAVDGRSCKLHDGTEVRISKAAHKAKIVRFKEHRYFSTLREKMMWGMDQR